MRLERGDIWDRLNRKYHIVIPVNVGWSRDGKNIMGKGLAKEAKLRYPACDIWLGEEQEFLFQSDPRIKDEDPRWIMQYPFGPLVFFPTKSLDREKPWHSWAYPSKYETIESLLTAFPAWAAERKLERVAFPLLGAGNGKLDPIKVKDLIMTRLKDQPEYVLVTPIYI